MKALVILPPTGLAARLVETALKLSRDLVVFYAADSKNPFLEERIKSAGARLTIKSERGELTTDALRVAAIENVDIIIAPDKFSKSAKGISKATEAIVIASPVSVLVIK